MNAIVPTSKTSVTIAMAERFGMEAQAFEATVRATCMPTGGSREEFAAFLLVAREYDLNPLTREIYAFPKRGGGIIPIVSIDGWLNLINRRAELDGIQFVENHTPDGKLISITCQIYRKDRRLPVEVTEHLAECKRSTDPWKMEHRMLRHKALIQCARYAFGFAGIYDEDEAERFAAPQVATLTPPPPPKMNPQAPAPRYVQEVIAPAAPPITEIVQPPAVETMDAGVQAPSQHEPPASTPSSEPDDAFDPALMMSEVGEHLDAALTFEHVEEIESLYADDVERLSRTDREAYTHLFEQARERIRKDQDKVTTSKAPAPTDGQGSFSDEIVEDADILTDEPAAPKADPFAIPSSFGSPDDYRGWIETMAKSAQIADHAALLKKGWKDTQLTRTELGMSMTTRKDLQGILEAAMRRVLGE